MGLGILRALRPGLDLAAAAVAPTAIPGPPLSLASPWAPRPNHLASVVWNDVFGADFAQPLDRAQAMAVPAVARARHVIAGTVGRMSMHAYAAAEVQAAEREDRTPVPLPVQPAWMTATDSALPAFHRAVWTADDLLFFGWSCWVRTNDAAGRLPLRMDRVRMGAWSLEDGTTRVKLDRGDGVHELVDQRTVCLIPGPHEGLLVFGQDAVRHARDLQVAIGKAAENPTAYLAIRQTDGEDLEDDEIEKLLDHWAEARRRRGGVGFLGRGLEAQEIGSFAAHLVESGRNAAAVDIARAASLPADLLDAAGESSLTYANSRDNDVRAIQYGVGLYLSAISARLSQNDVSPLGTVARFALESWLENPVPASASQPASQPAAPAPASTPAPGVAQ